MLVNSVGEVGPAAGRHAVGHVDDLARIAAHAGPLAEVRENSIFAISVWSAARAKPARDTKARQMSEEIDLRPPWPGNYTARPSVCASVSGWSTHDAYPQRSPLATIDYLARHVAGRSFCELGSRHGDISACLKPHALASPVLKTTLLRICGER